MFFSGETAGLAEGVAELCPNAEQERDAAKRRGSRRGMLMDVGRWNDRVGSVVNHQKPALQPGYLVTFTSGLPK